MGNTLAVGDRLWYCQCLTAHPINNHQELRTKSAEKTGNFATRRASADATRPSLTPVSETRVPHQPTITGNQDHPPSPAASDSGICLTPIGMPRRLTLKPGTSPALVPPNIRLSSPTSVDSGSPTTQEDLKVKRSTSNRPASGGVWLDIRRRLFRRSGHGSSSDSRSTCASPDSSGQQSQTASGPLDLKADQRPSSAAPLSAPGPPPVSPSGSTDNVLPLLAQKPSAPVTCCTRTTAVQTCLPRLRVSGADSSSRSPRARSHPYARPSGFLHDLSPVHTPSLSGDFGEKPLSRATDVGRASFTACKTTATSPSSYWGHSNELVSYAVVSTAVGSDSAVIPEGGPSTRHRVFLPWNHKSKPRSFVLDNALLLSNGAPLSDAGASVSLDSSPSHDNSGALKPADTSLHETASGNPESSCHNDGSERFATGIGDYRLLRSLPGLVSNPRLRSYSTSCSLRSPRHTVRRDGRAATLVCDPMHIKRVTCSVICEKADEDPFAPDKSAFILSNDQQRQFLQSLNGVKLALLKLRRILKEVQHDAQTVGEMTAMHSLPAELLNQTRRLLHTSLITAAKTVADQMEKNIGHRHAFQDQLDSRSSTLQRARLSGGALTFDLSSSTTVTDYPTPEAASTPTRLSGLLAEDLDRRLRLSQFSQTFDAPGLDVEAPFSAPPSQETCDFFSFPAQPSSSRFLLSSGDCPLPRTLEEALEEIIKLRTENAELRAKIARADDASRQQNWYV